MNSYQLTSIPPVRTPLQRLSEWFGAATHPVRPFADGADRIRLRRRSIPEGGNIPAVTREELLIVSGDVKLLNGGRVIGMRYAGDTIPPYDLSGSMTMVAHTDVCVMQLPRR